jgi:hypothetical protein
MDFRSYGSGIRVNLQSFRKIENNFGSKMEMILINPHWKSQYDRKVMARNIHSFAQIETMGIEALHA